MDIVDSWVAVG